MALKFPWKMECCIVCAQRIMIHMMQWTFDWWWISPTAIVYSSLGQSWSWNETNHHYSYRWNQLWTVKNVY